MSFKLLGYMLKHAEMEDREIDSVRENKAGLDNAPNGQALSAEMGVFGCWRSLTRGCEHLGCLLQTR